jgi:hypothetical protein
VAAARKASRYFRSAVSNLPAQHKAAQPNRHHPYHAAPSRHPEKCYFFRAGGFPKVPAAAPPVCIPFANAFQRLLTAHRKPGLCAVGLPVISAFQRHSTQHLLHYWSPFGFHFCCRGVPSGCVQRTGCSACGLGHPHQVWWAPPMYVYIARAWPR